MNAPGLRFFRDLQRLFAAGVARIWDFGICTVVAICPGEAKAMLKTAMVLVCLATAAALPAYGQTASHPSASSSHAAAPAPQTLAANQFSSESAAKAHCPSDTIVWANLAGSKAYHTSGDRYFGKTKHGAYMCLKDADQAGFHAAGSRASKTATKTTNAKATTK
jgi:hypothetical protein